MSVQTAVIMVRAAALALERVGDQRSLLWAKHLREDLKTLSLLAQVEREPVDAVPEVR